MNFQQEICDLLPKLEVGGGDLDEAIFETLLLTRKKPGKLLFIGNGGSAAIASHMAIDWTKNAGKLAMAFNDCAALTAIGNDIHFSRIFAFPVLRFGVRDDILFAMSSSGQSQDILDAVYAAKTNGISVITFSGFSPKNPLREQGMINFYVPSNDYGLVECWHLILNHAILNAAIGLRNACAGKR